jgi:hypothetical protein
VTVRRSLLAVAALAAAAALLVPAFAPADVGPPKGSAKIILTIRITGLAPHADHLTYCAVDLYRARTFGVNTGSFVGDCSTTDAKGVAKLTRVPKGRWGLVAIGETGSCLYPDCVPSHGKRIRIRAKRTHRVTWYEPNWGS